MVNKRLFWGILAMTLALGITVTGCDDGNKDNDIIPAKWQGTYTSDWEGTFTIFPTGDAVWIGMHWSSEPHGSISGVRIVKGGTFSAPGIAGEYVYLVINGINCGIILNLSPAVAGIQNVLGMGTYGASELIYAASEFGGTFSPAPNILYFPGFPGDGEGGFFTK